MKRFIYFSIGLSCLVLGLIGVVLPLLPTTPFVILAAFCFSKSSHRFHQKLLNNRLFGPMIADWERYGVIPFKVKCISSSMMLVMISYPVFFKQLPLWADISMLVTALVALLYIWSKPSQPAVENLTTTAPND
ncbi:MAG: YbaN family protein [Motiliproteus sp.]